MTNNNDKAASSQIQELIKKAEAELLSSQDSQYPDEGFESRVQARITALYECKSLIAHAEAQHAERVRGLLKALKAIEQHGECVDSCRTATKALAEHRTESENV